MSKTIKVIFTLSILLNIALLGVVAGMAAKRLHDPSWNEIKAQLKPETQALMRQTFVAKRDKIWTTIRTMKEKKKQMEDILGAPEFDAAAFDAAVKDWQAFHAVTTKGKMETFSGVLQQLPQEERKKLAGHFVNMITGQRHSKGDGEKSFRDKMNERQESGHKSEEQLENQPAEAQP